MIPCKERPLCVLLISIRDAWIIQNIRAIGGQGKQGGIDIVWI
jgi:hypothetical protein